MATTIKQQVAMDEALVPSTQRLKIGRSNLRLPSDIQSKESTLQLVYDVIRRCPFFKAFLVTADVPEIYMQELWATSYYDAMLPIELTNDKIGNTKAYKEYYAFTTGEAVPKPKAGARRKMSDSDTFITPPATTTPKPTVAVTPRLIAAAKGKQTAKSLPTPSEPGGFGTDEGTGSKPGVLDVPTDESEEELSWNSSDDESANDQVKGRDDDEGDEGDESDEGEEDADEEKDGDERDDNEENQETAKYDEHDDAEGGGNDEEEDESDDEDDNEETKEEESFDPILKTPKGSEDEGDGEEDQGLNVNKEEHVEEEEEDELYRDVNINQGRGLQATLEVEDTLVTLTLINSDGQQESSSVSSQFVTSMLNPTSDVAVSNIMGIVHQYMNQQMNEAVRVAVQIQTNRLRDSYQRENDEFLRTINENMKKIITEQVKGQVKEQVSKILPRIKQSVNAQLEAEVLTRLSHSSRTSYAVAADLSEMELKKILIEKMKGNKSIHRSNEQRNLYKALVDAYEADKIILDSYRETVILKRRRDDDDDQDKGPFAGLDRGLRDGEKVSASESAFAEEPVGLLLRLKNPHIRCLKQPFSLIPDNRGRRVIPFAHFMNNDLEYLRGGAFSRKFTTSVMKTKAVDYEQIKWIEDLFYGFAVNWESALDVYSKRRIIAVTDLKIVEWHSYKHLDWITIR
nr:hypothetical protein [Tanacetum cinerariifolium]